MKSLLLDAVTISAAVAALWVLFACPALADPPRYTIKNIFPIPEDFFLGRFGVEINNAGQVVVFVPDDESSFLYDDRDGSLTPVDDVDITDINELGVMVGFHDHGLVAVYENGVATLISEFEGTFPPSRSGGINDAGEVSGYLDPPPEDRVFHAFLYADGTLQLLDLSVDQGSCTGSQALDINNAGQIVGAISMPTDSGCVFEAFLHENGETVLLGESLSDDHRTEAVAINESGQVIVQVRELVFGLGLEPREAYLYSDGGLQRIGGDNTEASGLNNSGWVVGSTGGHAFLYIDGELHDLNDLVTDLTGWVNLASALDINDSGQITGGGELPRPDPLDRTWSFLLTPVDGEVQIDVRPGQKNTINLRSQGNIGVAIFSTREFDATQVDWETVTFGPGLAREIHQRSHVSDVDNDGDMDAVLHFRIRDTGIRCGDEQVTLNGETFDGQAFTGTDAIDVVKCL